MTQQGHSSYSMSTFIFLQFLLLSSNSSLDSLIGSASPWCFIFGMFFLRPIDRAGSVEEALESTGHEIWRTMNFFFITHWLSLFLLTSSSCFGNGSNGTTCPYTWMNTPLPFAFQFIRTFQFCRNSNMKKCLEVSWSQAINQYVFYFTSVWVLFLGHSILTINSYAV